jgi:hypothetical protein
MLKQNNSCSITGCSMTAARACATCGRLLCRECWCQHEIDIVRARNLGQRDVTAA